MVKSFFVFLFFWVATALGAISSNVPTRTSAYHVVDFLEAYRCAYSTFRILRPQSHLDLRAAVYAEGSEQCVAPEWLLKERSLLFHPVLPFEVFVSPVLVQNDFLPLLDTESTITPLFPLREGRAAYNGINVYTEFHANMASGQASNFGFALSVTPGLLTVLENYESFKGELYLHEWYAKAGYKWAEILLGRTPYQFGGAKHGSLLLSESALPYDMLKFSLRPHVLGTPFGFLGPFTFETWVARLGESQFISNSNLWAVVLGFRPLTWLEIAFLELNHFGGDGAPELDISDYLKMLAYLGDSDLVTKRNRSFAMHLNIWAPSQSAKFYFQLHFDGLSEISKWFTDDISTLVGIWFPKMGKADLRLEYVRTVPTAYRHSFWRQGLSHRATPIGHPLGPDAEGIYLDLGLPEFWGLRNELGFSYEARAKNPAAGYLTEYRYGVGLNIQTRLNKTFLKFSVKGAHVKNQHYQNVADNNVVAIAGMLRYSFL